MNLQSALKYNLNTQKRPIMIYYLVIIILNLLMLVSLLNIEGTGQINGFEFATLIFLFVLGLCSFKEIFLMFAQNGISRKTMFISSNITAVAASVFMALIDKMFWLIDRPVFGRTDNISFSSLFESIYVTQSAHMSTAHLFFESLLFSICLNLAFVSIGLFITTAYYRMNKPAKISVSVGVPAFLFIILPILLHLFGKHIPHGLVIFFADLINSIMAHPGYGMLTGIIMFVLFDFFYWLLMRKASVKS